MKDSSIDLRERVLASIRSEPSLPRSAVRRQVRAFFVVGSGLSVASFFVVGGVVEGERSLSFILVSALVWTFFALMATWVSFGKERRMVGASRAVLFVTTLALPITLLASFAMLLSVWPNPPTGPASVVHTFACVGVTLLMATGPFAAILFSRRHTVPLYPRLCGAALGATVGAWAGVMIDLHCSVGNLTHVLWGHIMPAVLLSIVGGVVGHRVLGIHAQRQIP